MAGAEQDRRGNVEKASTGIRNVGILIAILGIIGILAGFTAEKIALLGGGVAAAGEVGRGAAGSGRARQ